MQAETGNWFFIWANSFGWFAKEDRNFTIENKKVFKLTPKLGEQNGFSVYAGEDGNDLQRKNKFSRTILITRPGLLPYTPVTRKQYLLAFLKYREDDYNKNVAIELKRPRRTDAEEEIVKQKGLDKTLQLAGSNEKVRELAENRYLRFYVSDKQERQNLLTRLELNYQNDTKAAKDFLSSQSAEELAKPAILNTQYFIGAFTQFVTEDKGCMIVQVNDNYFNNKLPAYMPQFLVAYWSWSAHKPAVNFGTQVENNLDVKALQQMLDK